MSHNDWMWSRYYKIKKYCGDSIGNYEATHQGMYIDGNILIAKKKNRFRVKGCVFWSHYTAKGLGTAIKENKVLNYYLHMLGDPKSSENPINTDLTSDQWKEKRGDRITEYELNALDFLEAAIYETELYEVEY